MNPIPQVLANLMASAKNRHVSLPLAAALVCELGKIWLPHYMSQWSATQKLLMAYGILASANSGPSQPQVILPTLGAATGNTGRVTIVQTGTV